MTVATLDGLTIPEPGIAVLRAVMNQHWRLIVADYRALRFADSPERFGVPRLVDELLAADPHGLVRVLRTPMIAGLIGACRRLSRDAEAERRMLVTQLELSIVTELAMRGELPREHRVVVSAPSTLRSIAWGRAADVPAGALVFAPGSITFEGRSGREAVVGDPAFHRIDTGFFLATSDSNPLLDVKAHPERDGNRIDLGGHDRDAWIAKLCEALAIIREYAPATYDEMRLGLELVVPVGSHTDRHFSVSYRDSVGAVYMTFHTNVMTLVEALIHEFQHNKLNAVFHWDSILENANSAIFASPIRPDPRPLSGVLMAVHAFLPVARIYREMTRAGHVLSKGRDWEKRFLEIASANQSAAATLREHARPTRLGRGLLDEVARWNVALGDLRSP